MSLDDLEWVLFGQVSSFVLSKTVFLVGYDSVNLTFTLSSVE